MTFDRKTLKDKFKKNITHILIVRNLHRFPVDFKFPRMLTLHFSILLLLSLLLISYNSIISTINFNFNNNNTKNKLIKNFKTFYFEVATLRT